MNKDLMRMLWIAAVLVAITAGAALIYSSQRDTAERAGNGPATLRNPPTRLHNR